MSIYQFIAWGRRSALDNISSEPEKKQYWFGSFVPLLNDEDWLSMTLQLSRLKQAAADALQRIDIIIGVTMEQRLALGSGQDLCK